MSSQQKRGFRLPWAGEREPGEDAGTATLENGQTPPVRLDLLKGAVGDGLGEGPFHFAEDSTPPASTDASPEAPDVPETTGEAPMIDTESGTTELADAATTTEADASPATDPDAVAEATAEPEDAAVDPDVLIGESAVETPAPAASKSKAQVTQRTAPATRTNPLVAGLIKAMREAALASRAETTSRLQAEATARVEAIRTDGTEESAALRKRVDEDIAGIRDWSKGEMARIRQQTEERIEGRRTEAIAENDRHTAHVEYLVEEVQARVQAFEADMDGFFERLLAENDPAALAALAERAPDPPDLTAELEAEAEAEPEAHGEAQTTDEWHGVAWTNPGLEADAAAEAEAEATEGLDLSSDEQWPASVLAAARRNDTPDEDAPTGAGNSRLFVSGLTSVAGISAFKGAVGQLPGISSVSVSSGEPGVFIFAVAHSPETDLQAAIAGLTQFETRVTEASGDSLTVSAHEPAA
jgi:hypothetical protein